jgi:uncharacterized protein DUF3892
MAVSVRITCVSKDNGFHENPHVAISLLGWINESTSESGQSTRLEMHKFITDGGQAYVRDARGNTAHLVAKTSVRGNPFVQTIADGTPTDNLLRLQECH